MGLTVILLLSILLPFTQTMAAMTMENTAQIVSTQTRHASDTKTHTTNTQTDILKIYVKTGGNDQHNGRSVNTAVASISRAYAIVKATLKQQHTNAEILLAPGTYVNQRVVMDWYMPHHTITIKPINNTQPKPLITSTPTWKMAAFKIVTRAQGERTNFIFKNLKFKHMYGAITFSGNREMHQASSSYNIIDSCEFDNTGMTAFSTIGIVNSQYNQLINNQFINQFRHIGGTTDGLLHAIYIAHNSKNNLIKNNYFENCDGDPIRVRDTSHNNVITKNTFTRCGTKASVSEWFCNADFHRNCTKKSAECPSYNTLVQDNRISLQGWIPNQKYSAVYQATPAKKVQGCPTHTGLSRIIEKGTIRF